MTDNNPNNALIPVLRTDFPQAFDSAALSVLPKGEFVTIGIDVFWGEAMQMTLTFEQAKAMRATLNDAIGKAAFCVLQRQQSGEQGHDANHQ